MRILHLLWDLNNGGIQNMVADIVGIQARNNDVTVVICTDQVSPSILKRFNRLCKVKLLNYHIGSYNYLPLLKLQFLVLLGHFDVVHHHLPVTYCRLFFKLGKQLMTVHNTGMLKKFSYPKCKLSLIAISDAVYKEFIDSGYNNICKINNGVFVEKIQSKTEKDYYDGKSVLKIVQVSRIYFKQKGQDLLCEACEKLINKGITNFHVDIIGDGGDIENLKNLVVTKGLSDFISILGNKDREYVYAHLKDYDLFIQPSRFEGFGLTVAEAMSAKVPVLVSANEGPIQIIEDGKFGFSFINKSVDDMTSQITFILRHYPTMISLEKAYKHICENYSLERTALYYEELYKVNTLTK